MAPFDRASDAPSRARLIALFIGTVVPILAFSGATSAQVPTVPEAPPPPDPPVKKTRTVALNAKLRVRQRGGDYLGSGPVSGKPFGKGRFNSRSKLTSRSPLRTASTFVATYKRGKITFKGTGRYVGSTFKATIRVTSGTRAFRDITGRNLTFTSVNRGGIERVRVKGKVRYTHPG